MPHRSPSPVFVISVIAWGLVGSLHRAEAQASPTPSAPPSSGASSTVPGVYVLSRAHGAKPPTAFTLPLMGFTATGTLHSARVTFASDGTFASDVEVQWDNAPPLPIPGMGSPGEKRMLHGTGRWTAHANTIVLEPTDFLTRQLVSTVTARTSGDGIILIDGTGGLAGDRVPLSAEFKRLH